MSAMPRQWLVLLPRGTYLISPTKSNRTWLRLHESNLSIHVVGICVYVLSLSLSLLHPQPISSSVSLSTSLIYIYIYTP